MSMLNGNSVAKYVVQGIVDLIGTSWTPLQVSTAPHKNRFAVRIFVKGAPGQAVALAYANINSDGSTFTSPTTTTGESTVYPGGRTWIEPLSDKVTLYGRLIAKAGSTKNSVRVIVTEFS